MYAPTIFIVFLLSCWYKKKSKHAGS